MNTLTLAVTKEMIEKMENWLEKPFSQFTDVEAVTMVEEFVNPTTEVTYASWSDDETIYYRLADEETPNEAERIAGDCKRAKFLGLD